MTLSTCKSVPQKGSPSTSHHSQTLLLTSCPSFSAQLLKDAYTQDLLFLGTSSARLNALQSVFHLSCPMKAASLITPMTPTAEFNISVQSTLCRIYQKHLTIPPALLRHASLFSLGFHNTKLCQSSFYVSVYGLPMLFAESLHPTLSQSCTGLSVRPSPLLTTPYLSQGIYSTPLVSIVMKCM